jgi:hypothetical protein
LKRTNSEHCKTWYKANRERKLAYEARRRPIIGERQAARKRWLYHNDPEYHAHQKEKARAYARDHKSEKREYDHINKTTSGIVAKMIADTRNDPLLEKDSKVRFAYGRTKKREL